MKTMSFDFNSRRSMISARRGMVGASNPLAAQAGLNILRQGRNIPAVPLVIIGIAP